MEKVINLGIPHVGELIFESIDTRGLIECALVSETWKLLAVNVLLKRWENIIEASKSGKAEVVRIFLERSKNLDCELEERDNDGLTAFMSACKLGHTDVVQLLLDYSNAQDEIVIEDDECSTFELVCNNGQKNCY